MNNKHQENAALRAPLIFTVPAYGFVMALYFDWLGRSKQAPFSAKSFAEELEPVEPARSKLPQQAVKTLVLFPKR